MRTGYFPWILLVAAVLTGCRGEHPDPHEGFAAVELFSTGSVQVSRSGSVDDIGSVTFLVFNADGSQRLQYKTVDYENGGRIFLRVGSTYQVYAVANLQDGNCPAGYTVDSWLDVSAPSELNAKYALASPTGQVERVIMSGGLTVEVTSTADVKLILRRLHTKIQVDIYNKAGSGVELHSYYLNNLPSGSYLFEQAGDYTSAGYGFTEQVHLSGVASTTEGEYTKQSVSFYCFENRRGTDTRITHVRDRKAYAPDNALEIDLIGYVGTGVLNTYVLPGKGRDQVTGTDRIDNFDVDRNCVYYIDVRIDNTENISIDSRREYLDYDLCGDLDSPGSGTWGDFDGTSN